MSEEAMLIKVVDTEVKEVSDRVLEFVGSTEKQDRDGEVIKAEGWDLKNYKKNPVFMWAHDYRQPPVGKTNRVWVDEGSLKFKVEFAPPETYEFADTIYKLYKGGFLKATSVGFVPKEWSDGEDEKAPRRTYNKQELLELSGVPVPSNPDALMIARDSGVITTKEFEAVTKVEVTENYIRIPVPGEQGKHDGHRIRTITISKEKGIKALYCGECKKNITYLFDKEKWTVAEAQRWVDEHKEFEVIGEMEMPELKGAIPYKKTPLADEGAEWDAGKEVKQAEVDDLKIMCAWVGEDPDLKTSYKLPHHRASGSHECVWRGVAAAGAVIMGARGGIAIPSGDVAGVKAHLAKHYKEFDKEPPWEKGVSQAEIVDELDYIIRLIDTEGMNEEVKEDAWNLVREVMRLSGDDIPVDILEKVGAVLNSKNRQRLNDIKRLAQEVIDSAEREEPKKDDKKEVVNIKEEVKAIFKEALEEAQGKI